MTDDPSIKRFKEMAQKARIFDERMQDVVCTVCSEQDGDQVRQRQFITIYEELQTRNCPGLNGNSHVLYLDAKGKYLWAVEHLSGNPDWRESIDHARTEGVKPQTMAWETEKRPRRLGGRRPKRGRGKGGRWTQYVSPDEED